METETGRTRRGPGPRVARRGARRRITRKRLARTGIVLIALAIALPLGGRLIDRTPQSPATPATEFRATGDPTWLLLAVHAPQGGPATSLTLLGATGDGGLVLFIPVGVLVDIPGYGQDLIAAALRYGGTGLLRSTVENVLGVPLSGVVSLSERGLATLFDRAGGIHVDGVFVNGARALSLWRSQDQELEAFTRRQVLLGALFSRVSQRPHLAARLFGSAPVVTDLAASEVAQLIERLAEAHEAEVLTTTLLPVEPFGPGGPQGERTYRIREAEAEQLVTTWMQGGVASRGVRVQILNGVGVPGLAQRVDQLLHGGEFRVVLTENAPHFNFQETQIVLYRDTPDQRDLAAQVRELLGVGSITISRQPQSVVDLTIVIGADFVDLHDEPAGNEEE